MLRPILVVIALAASGLASGQASEPERIARLSYVEGGVTFHGAQTVSPTALPDRPLDPGDRLSTARDGRVEAALGNATLRLDQDSAVTFEDIAASAVRLELTAGSASLHVNDLYDGETFEIATLNTTVAVREPGEYRVDITPSGATELSVRAGDAEVATAGGPVRVADGQRVRLEGRAEFASLVTPRAADDFDEWVLEREVLLAESAPPRSESEEIYSNETLEQYGEWQDDPGYGQVWMPSYAYGGYDPFAYGYWQRSGFGYSWYDPMPWSSYTFHNGYWTYLEDRNRWAWVAQRRDLQRRAARTTHQLDRALDDDRSQGGRGTTHPVGRPNSAELERRAEATSSGLGRRIEAERRPAPQRNVEPTKNTRSVPATGSTSKPRSAPASQGSARPTLQPARPASSSSSSNSGSSQASRAAAASAAAKGALSRPQEP